VKKNREQAKLMQIPGERRRGPGPMAAREQAAQAERALEGMFEVMITGVDGLIITGFALETFHDPPKDGGHELAVSVGETVQISRLNMVLDGVGIACIHMAEHREEGRMGGAVLHAENRRLKVELCHQ